MEQVNSSETTPLYQYRMFMARIMATWLFLILLLYWACKALPFYHIDIPGYIDPHVFRTDTLLWVATSTLLLFFLILPGRYTAIILAFLMGFFIYTYLYTGRSLFNPAFVWVLIPFAVPIRWFLQAWLGLKWILLLSLVLHAWWLPLSVTAIPGYTLYLIPFIAWEYVFRSFMEKYEPK
jgi:hypothetical protein